MIVQVNVVPNRTVVDSDWRFDNLYTLTLKMTTEKFVETSVTVKLSDYIHPDDHIPPTYTFAMEITTGDENGTFDTRWENDQINFQRGIVLPSLILWLIYRALIENYVLLSIEIVFVCLVFSSQRFTRHSMLSCHNKYPWKGFPRPLENCGGLPYKWKKPFSNEPFRIWSHSGYFKW